jgi:P27 family predicted phage terminase small subunit
MLRGNPSRRPLRSELRVEILGELPRAPEFLDGTAADCWRQLGGELVKASVLSTLDLDVLAIYAETRSRWIMATRLLNGLELPDKRFRPLVRIQRDAGRDLVALAQHFGATPVSRARVSSAPGGGAPSKFGDLISGDPA